MIVPANQKLSLYESLFWSRLLLLADVSQKCAIGGENRLALHSNMLSC